MTVRARQAGDTLWPTRRRSVAWSHASVPLSSERGCNLVKEDRGGRDGGTGAEEERVDWLWVSCCRRGGES